MEDVEATVARRVRLHQLALFAVARARLHRVAAPAVGDVVPGADGAVAAVPRPRRANRGLDHPDDIVTADESLAGRRRHALAAVRGALVHHVVAAPPRRPEVRVFGSPVAALPRSTTSSSSSSSAAGETNRVGAVIGVAGSGVGGGAEADSDGKKGDDEHRRDDDGAGDHAALLTAFFLQLPVKKLSATVASL